MPPVIGGRHMGAGIVHFPDPRAHSRSPGRSESRRRLRGAGADQAACSTTTCRRARSIRLAAPSCAESAYRPTTEWTGLELADVVVEAVLETIEAKRDVFARLDRLTRPHAVLATNTSSLRVSEMAQATLHPERVVGLHFFNPVAKMPLVEIVRGAHSDPASLATAVALAVRMGKTPVLVGDSPGFLVNRILVPYLAEALAMAGEGVPIRAIDDAMKSWGMPMGAFELLDEIGLDIASHVVKIARPARRLRLPTSRRCSTAQRIASGWGRRAARASTSIAKIVVAPARRR
jgi:3-hydroxyacyl-CoA dehydrogenase/enoyl-CoA hydratase/3-hydroxybutyryl-CoA epimerase